MRGVAAPVFAPESRAAQAEAAEFGGLDFALLQEYLLDDGVVDHGGAPGAHAPPPRTSMDVLGGGPGGAANAHLRRSVDLLPSPPPDAGLGGLGVPSGVAFGAPPPPPPPASY